MSTQKHIVVIGGGTGTSTVVTGLKTKPVEITAVVSMADSGGSTGRLRDEFGFQPVGDLRQSLAALASSSSQTWIRNLLLYRFEKGEGLKGHNLGNLILTALQDMAGSTNSALEIAEQVFRLDGKVYPVTTTPVQLRIEYEDGSIVVGEDSLNENTMVGKKIRGVSLTPEAHLYEKAANAIAAADAVVIGPGDYYASIMAALAPKGMKDVFRAIRGKVIYVVNLMTRYNQTHEMSVEDHVRGIEEAIGRKLDIILVNNGTIPREVLQDYAKEKEYPVEVTGSDARYHQLDLISDQIAEQSKADVLHRSLLRHDPAKLAIALLEVL
ncbi:MAG TPA: uridine diphosphate-N-acetylglucosamine-binding protein YvcK [Candidatus Saccharimonadia bacterium]|nr:uridine diphosphate-N-acetylglucosamine-binding protein YvcK [Candidatus Saccharimonadia bacterium]